MSFFKNRKNSKKNKQKNNQENSEKSSLLTQHPQFSSNSLFTLRKKITYETISMTSSDYRFSKSTKEYIIKK